MYSRKFFCHDSFQSFPPLEQLTSSLSALKCFYFVGGKFFCLPFLRAAFCAKHILPALSLPLAARSAIFTTSVTNYLSSRPIAFPLSTSFCRRRFPTKAGC